MVWAEIFAQMRKTPVTVGVAAAFALAQHAALGLLLAAVLGALLAGIGEVRCARKSS